jgi:uncharacterized protein YecE (DUF72 family)
MKESLPPEPFNNSTVLKGKSNDFKLYYGANKWGRTEWIGKLYPEGTKEAKHLEHYVEHFNSIELNATHYKTYSPDQIKKWAEKAEGKDFMFCPKMWQAISHYSSFVNIEEKTKTFLDSLYAFGEHLGPIFIQVSDKYTPKRKEPLFRYLKTLPKNLQFFLEIRHRDWFETQEYELLLQFLKGNGIGLVISDVPPRTLTLDLTVPKCFIRYQPRGDKDRLEQWYNKLKEWESKGLEKAYFFVGSEVNGGAMQALENLEYFDKLVKGK